jgi:hypothetical protein
MQTQSCRRHVDSSTGSRGSRLAHGRVDLYSLIFTLSQRGCYDVTDVSINRSRATGGAIEKMKTTFI